MMTTVEKETTCQRCGNTFHWTPASGYTDQQWIEMFRPRECEPCSGIARQEGKELQEKREAERLSRRTQAALEQLEITLGDAVPARYLETNVEDTHFNLNLWEAVREWRRTDETPWIGLVGPSGRCKTRAAALLARQMLRKWIERTGAEASSWDHSPLVPPDFLFQPCHEIATLATARFSEGEEDSHRSPRARLRRIREAPLLLLDDIGKIRLSPAVAAEFFGIIDHRHSHNLATIWTSNLPPEALFASLPEDMAGPLAGRFHDCSKIFTVR